jgi:hypothetical protein
MYGIGSLLYSKTEFLSEYKMKYFETKFKHKLEFLYMYAYIIKHAKKSV